MKAAIHLISDESGTALIEFSLLLPFLVFAFLGALDYASVIRQSIAINDAAAAAARYGTSPGNATNFSGIQTLATNTAAGTTNFQVTATNFCTCSPGGSVVSCTSTCASSNPAEYVKVTTSATPRLPFSLVGLPSTISLSAASTMRVSWFQ